MKKQTKIIIAIIVAVAIIIIAVGFLYPPAFKGLTSGTIGKADKYRKDQMTEKDVQLRSELTEDTAQLRNMIQGLIYFSLFTQDLSSKIDSCIGIFQSHGICKEAGGCEKIQLLQDYSDFIKNNNKTLGTTISMLTGFYLRDESDQSADVERNLRNFGNYVSELTERDSVVDQALRSMDNFMLSNKFLKAKSAEVASLKSIRDQLLVKGIQLAGVLQDKPLCGNLCAYALSVQQELNIVVNGQEVLHEQLMAGSQEKLNIIANAEKLGALLVGSQISMNSSQQLGDMISSQQLGKQVQSQEKGLGALAGTAILYDAAHLQFVVGNIAELQKVISAAELSGILQGTALGGGEIIVGSFTTLGMNLCQSNYTLLNAMQNQALSSVLSSSQISSFLSSSQDLGSMALSSSFVSGMQQLNNLGLGVSISHE